MIWGKAIGTVLGYIVAGWIGAVVGFLIGHMFDLGLSQQALLDGIFQSAAKRNKIQQAFFEATFQIMGYVAKSDGRVSESEIATVEALMQNLRVTGEARVQAVALFNEGKRDGFNIEERLATLTKFFAENKILLQVFVEIQLQAAYAEGSMADAKKAVIIFICERLGLNRDVFARLNNMHQAEEKFKHYQQQRYYETFQKMRSNSATNDAYQMLGVDSKASDAEVKRAYRKLMSQHHPDKLIAKGLPESMIALATEKTQEIQKAYESIVESRSKLNLQ